jgi:hypothetical protein
MVHEAASPSSRAKSKSIGESPFTFPKFLGKFAFPSEFRDLADAAAPAKADRLVARNAVSDEAVAALLS